MLTPGHGFDASSVNYGGAEKSAYSPAFLRGACPVVGSFGAEDRTLRGAATRLEHALSELGVEHDVKEYPGAGHAFMNDHEGAGDPVPGVIALATKFTPTFGYVAEATLDARRRIIAFFGTHLQS